MRLICLSFVLLLAIRLPGAEMSATNLIAQAEEYSQKGETLQALKIYLEADRISPGNPEILCGIAKSYCDAMHTTNDPAVLKHYAQKALATALLLLTADPQNPRSHCCVAVCYAKNFPYLDNQTKVDYSRLIKAEAEKAIALDPKFDLAYHMLGRWHYEVSNMGMLVRGLVRVAYGGLPAASKQSAIENFKKAIQLAPNRIIHHLQLARLYHVTGQEKLATDELKQCTTLSPTDLDDKDAQNIAKKILGGAKWPEGI